MDEIVVGQLCYRLWTNRGWQLWFACGLIDKLCTMQAVYSGDGQMREASIVEILQDGEVSLRFKGVKVCILMFIKYFVKLILTFFYNLIINFLLNLIF